MTQTYMDTVAYHSMIADLKKMQADDISAQLHAMGCPLSYADLVERLRCTYNDLAVADALFEQYEIHAAAYPKAFLDEAILEITTRENFGFTHYGILSASLCDIINSDIAPKEKIDKLETTFRRLCQTAKKFKIHALETMQYQVNDGNDLYAFLMETLDLMMLEGRHERLYYKRVVALTDKILQSFTDSNAFLRTSILYEQANAYIAMKSKKGEQLYQQLMQTHSDPCDVVLHYALAYLDDDEARAIRIIKKYQTLWNEESEAYSVMMNILKDTNT